MNLNENIRLIEYRTTFELFDKDSDGRIAQDDLGNIMRSFGYEYTELELEDMFNDVCKKREKTISFDEFMVLMNKKTKEVDILEEYTEAFRIFDQEGEGKINISHLRQILISLGENIKEEEIDYMLKDADVKGDGYIEYKLFLKLLLSK
jgi:calmodulin